METEVTELKWGTWEELVLGSAVLRHGNGAWDAVAAELRARTLYPFFFTAEVCKAKYEELQKRFRGRTSSWFEELRKHRVAELKRELEKSDDSIGSLQSKLESLKAQKREEQQPGIKYGTGQTLSPTSVANSVGVDFSGKETSKDGLSAGSFTEETQTDWLPEPQAHEAQETETKIDQKETTTLRHHQIVGCASYGALKKRRGKRKRRDCGAIKEQNDVGSSVDKEESIDDCDRDRGPGHDRPVIVQCVTAVDRSNRAGSEELQVDLKKMLKSVVENESATLFRRRLDSQKKTRYRKIIRRHVDMESLRLKLLNRSIKSVQELYRDLLLLCTNALVFFPKDSGEFRSALLLRDVVKKTFRENQRVSGNESGSGSRSASVSCEKPPANSTVKPRSVRPGGTQKVAVEEIPEAKKIKKVSDGDILAVVQVEKKGKSSLVVEGEKKGKSSPVVEGEKKGKEGEKKGKSSPVVEVEKKRKSSSVMEGEKKGKSSPVVKVEKKGKSSPVVEGEKMGKSSPVVEGEKKGNSSPMVEGEKKGKSRPKNVGRNSVRKQPETPVKEKKKARRK